MKKINKKILIITILICLLPIIYGAFFYDQLPSKMPIHFNINNEVDREASKEFTLFAMPMILLVLQLLCYFICSIKATDEEGNPKFVNVVFWIIPIMTNIISIVTIKVVLGNIIDVRKVILVFLGAIFIVMGNYTPKITYEKAVKIMNPKPKDEKSFRALSRAMGYTYVLGGIVLLITILFAPIVSFIALLLFILIIIIEGIYYSISK